jgi:hypothetical protein
MSCDYARNWLLQAERPGVLDHVPVDVAIHLDGCDACRKLTHRLQQLEQAHRDTPLPPGADEAREAFLADLAERPGVRLREAPAALRRRHPLLRWALAASVLLVAATASLLFWAGSRAQASAEVVDRLVDWNVELAQASSRADRDRIFVEQRDRLAGELSAARLPGAERQLAESLVRNASWLRMNDDPVEAAERFDLVAGQLLDQLRTAADRNDRKIARRLARNYDRVSQLGFAVSLERAQASAALDFAHKRRLEKLLLRDEARMAALVALLEVAPDASRKEIKRALGLANAGKRQGKSGKRPTFEKPTSQN